MHPNPAFRQTPPEENLAFARARGFGTLTVNGPKGPLLSHIPFLLAEDGASAEFHLVRSNPLARALLEGGLPAVLAVTGPEGYVSPDWYGIEGQVPTWNYIAVHLRGAVALRPEAELQDLLARLSARFEGDLLPAKAPWTMDKMDGAALERMMRQIMPCRLTIADVQGTWKLAQNKPEPARLAAANGLAEAALSPEAAALAALMRGAAGA